MFSVERLKIGIIENNDAKRAEITAAIQPYSEILVNAQTYGQGKKCIPTLGNLGIRAMLVDGSLKDGGSREPIRQGDELALEIKEVYGASISVVNISRSRPVPADFDWDCNPANITRYLTKIAENFSYM